MSTKAIDIAKKISADSGFTMDESAAVLDSITNAIRDTLLLYGRIEIRNFGVFKLKKRAPRKARNINTGASVNVPSRHEPVFVPGKDLKTLEISVRE